MIKIAVVEDRKEDMQRVERFIARYGERHKEELFVVEKFWNAVDFLTDFQSNTDILFMDIEMPMMNGMEAAQNLRKAGIDVPLIFLTRMMQYATKGYEVDAIDFMVKPISYENFVIKLEKALKIVHKRRHKSVFIPFPNGMRHFYVSDITYIEVMQHDCFIHTRQGEVHKLAVSLKKLEKQFENFYFARSNTSYLVNLQNISKVDKTSVFVDGEELPISRTHKKNFLNALTVYLNESKSVPRKDDEEGVKDEGEEAAKDEEKKGGDNA